ncbi:galactose-3-O-sulfotransferase 4 isoform X2 [Colossoma macropomum]|uniref:galactose-3-O-sulfotransferase 4 isoform X2 n=1 Tax=Colossoma macropomum TaxID=42526 RepID=UPI001864F6EB|nr:galactose-3-O-sulfotransferase 4 isoform X2 [Colossoma macropomum]
MLCRRSARRMRWLGCYRLGPMWKAVLVFVVIAFAGQLLGVLFNKSWVQPERPRSLFSISSENGQVPPQGSCRPHTHVMFLKTHKTASSTVLNMLYRFGEEQGLRFALPVGYQFGYPLPFIAQRVKGYRGPHVAEFDIMGNHMRFNKPEVEKVMPADTFCFSILRDPVALAESSYAYYKNVAPAFRRAKGLGDFADNPRKYYDPRLRNNHYARNLLWYDFGLDHNANFSLALAKRGEATVRRNFRLILLSEYFDQSMVLLRHALCWPLDAVVSFSLNARQQMPKGRSGWVGKAAAPAPLALTEEQRQKLREWNALDWHLYQAFNRTFWAEVERFGRAQMETEVILLRSRREILARVCLRDGGQPVEASRIRDKAIRPFQSGLVKILGYELQPGLDNATKEACLRMIRPEIQYKDLLDLRQFPRAQQPPGPAVAAGGAAVRRDPLSSRTGEHLGESIERDWDRTILVRNQSIQQVDSKGKLR